MLDLDEALAKAAGIVDFQQLPGSFLDLYPSLLVPIFVILNVN